MTERAETTGEGTLYDPNGTQLATVAYRLGRTSPKGADVDSWGGDLFFPDPSMVVEPGIYALETEDGAEIEVQIEEMGATRGDGQTFRINGVGAMPRAIG